MPLSRSSVHGLDVHFCTPSTEMDSLVSGLPLALAANTATLPPRWDATRSVSMAATKTPTPPKMTQLRLAGRPGVVPATPAWLRSSVGGASVGGANEALATGLLEIRPPGGGTGIVLVRDKAGGGTSPGLGNEADEAPR